MKSQSSSNWRNINERKGEIMINFGVINHIINLTSEVNLGLSNSEEEIG